MPLPGAFPKLASDSLWDWAWLRQVNRPRSVKGRTIRVADVFSGCGMMSLGVAEAAHAVGARVELALAVDLESNAIEVCRRTFPECEGRTTPIEELVDREIGRPASRKEKAFLRETGGIDFLVGGPPCQGHSDFNNHTRRYDDRNSLALKVVRLAELTRPQHVVIENVRGIVHDRLGIFQAVRKHLGDLGYRTAERLLRSEEFGVAQTRWRMFLVATLAEDVAVEESLDLVRTPQRDFNWACGDLAASDRSDPFDCPPNPTERNRKRIEYLFRYKRWDLPDRQRPPCHQSGGHSYKSIYGRLWEDKPAQTITTGFRCMGQGRFVHPSEPRTITAHEAARLQFIPDFVDFSGLRPTAVAKLIGNAVPPKLLYGIALPLVASGT